MMTRLAGIFFIAVFTSIALGNGSSLNSNPDAIAGFTGSVAFRESSLKYAGDANCDGKVDVSDLGILASNYGKAQGAFQHTGDYNSDGKVDVSDLGILASNYGKVGQTLDVKVDYAVFEPGKFSNNTDYVYAYQIQNPNSLDAQMSQSDGSMTFVTEDYVKQQLSQGLSSNGILLVSSKFAPEFQQFTINKNGLSASGDLVFASSGGLPMALVPVPMSVLLGFMGLGLVDRLKRRA